MKTTKKNGATLLIDTKSTLGEGPVWDWKKQVLFWVDIEGCILHRYNPIRKEHHTWSFEHMVGAVVPTDKDTLLLALENGLARFKPTSETITPLAVLQNNRPEMRYNDGKVGPNGNFWIGSMHKQLAPNSGSLYRVDSHLKVTQMLSGTTISNGMAWTANHKLFYYIDTATQQVAQFSFDKSTSGITNKKVAFTIPESFGAPDGMTIDKEGMLWIAHWGGHAIRRWNPTTGEMIEKVGLPVPNVTSCCFGGENLDTLYIATARSGLNKAQLNEFPLSGGLFAFQTKVKGTPIYYFKET